MCDIFISYSSKDEEFAKSIYKTITAAGINTFLACISIDPGIKWSIEVFNRLRNAKWVFFIASKNSISSTAVQQELGASIALNKIIVPILIDIKPYDLPSWVGEYQAIDLNENPEKLTHTVNTIASEIGSNNFLNRVIIAGLLVFSIMLIKNSED